MILKKFLLPAFVFVFASLHGQQLKEDIRKINDYYANNKSFKIDMKINLYSGKTLTESVQYDYLQQNKTAYSKIGKVSTVVLDDYTLIIDERVKYIFLTGIADQSAPSITKSYDTLIDLATSYEFKVIDSLKNHLYILHFDALAYNKLELYFNPESHEIIKLKLFYDTENNEQKALEFIYGKITSLSTADKEKLSKSSYLSDKEGKVRLKSALKGFELIDYRTFKNN